MYTKIFFFLVLYLTTLSGIGIDLYAPSLPAIAHTFNVSEALIKSSISVYLFGFALGQIIFGPVSDSFGRKKTLLSGLFIFILASILAIYSHQIHLFMLARFLQGFGVASASIMCKALMTDVFSGKDLVVGTIYLAVVWSLCPILAPVVGGYLQFYFNWHANFYFYTIYSTLMFISVAVLLKETLRKRVSFDAKTILLNFKEILLHKIFFGSVLALGICYSLILTFNIVGPFLIQKTLGYNAKTFGHIALLVGSAYFFGTFSNRFLHNRYSVNQLFKLGLMITCSASLTMLFFAYEMPLSITTIVLPIFIAVYGTGFIFPNCLVKCMSFFPEKGGTASAALGFLNIFISAIATIIISFLKPGTLAPIAWAFIIISAMILFVYGFFLTENSQKT